MGTYINPGNEGFASIVRDDYVDKTGLIALVNEVVDTPRKLVAVTRPRRFGKTYAAESLAAYYCHGCDSRGLFEGLEISRDAGFEEHLNAYNVVKLDMSAFTSEFGPRVVAQVEERLRAELAAAFSDVDPGKWLTAALVNVAEATGRKFVFVIDEWDAPLREAKGDSDAREEWIMFLRLLFKNATFTSKAVAAAYMTGILPIKRYGTQSALSDFWEYTMLDAADYAPYVGFTEDEVEALARASGMDMEQLRAWYDGYDLPGAGHVYTPFSVVQACKRGRCAGYWTSTETFEMLRFYIDMDFDGLQQAVVQALGGADVAVRTGKFQNDMTEVRSRDDALTLLIHLGYLAYDADSRKAHVPNEEVREELRDALEESRHAEVARIVRDSEELLRATWDGDSRAVAQGIQRAHDNGCPPLFYNDEQALRAVVKAAYIAGADHYATIEELPSGRGFVDVVLLPKRGSSAPALVVELKWSKQPEAAIAQVREREYPAVLRGWGGPVLLVGITYDAETKEHSCAIEQA